ncbi:MAG: alpha-L-fucosidase [Chloroflexi bacterium]|nr:alpha-L-fucosidase [Chloroflexota bacterium]
MLKPEPTQGDTSWFIQDRFGMFIHWGAYAAAARHEWVRNREEMDDAAYQKYLDHFDPDLYDPKEWAQRAKDAGMKYAVITTKHHEGFCLWDSKLTDYKATNTPARRDLLRPWVEAFRAAGLKLGFYYSLIDWHHPEFTIDVFHPLRNHPAALEMNKTRDMRKYAEYLHAQTRELLTEFGKIDVMWFDFSYPGREYRGMPGKGHDDWQSDKLLKMVRELQPHIIVDNRLDLPPEQADIYTPEQVQPRGWVHVNGKPVVWETCQTFSGSWGYYRDEYTWKSPEQLIQMLVNSVSRGGNLLMNVGPTARGAFDDRAIKALDVYRAWMKLNARSIYGCTMSEFTAPPDCRLTQNGKRLYIHVFAWPFKHIHLEGLAGKVEYAQLLHDASQVPFAKFNHPQLAGVTEDMVSLELPVRKPDVVVPVIELFLK